MHEQAGWQRQLSLPELTAQDQGTHFFTTTMVEFLDGAERQAAELQAHVASTMAELQALYGYFGEKYDGNDPVRILSTIATFLDTFSKTIAAMQVRCASCAPGIACVLECARARLLLLHERWMCL